MTHHWTAEDDAFLMVAGITPIAATESSVLVFSTDNAHEVDFCEMCGQNVLDPKSDRWCPAEVELNFGTGKTLKTGGWYCHRCFRNQFSCECGEVN